MTLLIALLLAAAPAPAKPPAEGAALALDCSAYLANALGDAEKRGKREEGLQGQFEAWVRAYEASGPGLVETSGAVRAERSVALDKEPRKTRNARTAWCRANAPLEKSA